jgi:hypothetical protein
MYKWYSVYGTFTIVLYLFVVYLMTFFSNRVYSVSWKDDNFDDFERFWKGAVMA